MVELHQHVCILHLLVSLEGHELVRMGIIPSSDSVTDRHLAVYPNGFPIPTPDFVTANEQLLETARAATDNVTLLGKNIGKIWFMNEVLVDTYRQISAL